MKFDLIKKRAQDAFLMGIGNGGVSCSPAQFATILPFVKMGANERQDLRDFADAFEAKRGDWVASAAKGKYGMHSEWNRVMLRAREAGLDLIKNWDVRSVASLIKLFPDAVPKAMRDVPLTCFMADNDNCDWMVERA